MTDAELIDKKLAGPTEEEQRDLMTWEAASHNIKVSTMELFRLFHHLPMTKKTIDQIASIDQAYNNDDEYLEAGGVFVPICEAYRTYVECGQDCQNIHERLYWTGKTKQIPIFYLSDIYNHWLEAQPTISQ